MITHKHTQSSASVTWTITHNLELTSCAVEVFVDVAGVLKQFLPQNVTKTANEVVINFSSARAGVALVRGSIGEFVDYAGFVAPIERTIDYTHSPDA